MKCRLGVRPRFHGRLESNVHRTSHLERTSSRLPGISRRNTSMQESRRMHQSSGIRLEAFPAKTISASLVLLNVDELVAMINRRSVRAGGFVCRCISLVALFRALSVSRSLL
ncbi:hypothetical protein Zmor_019922 [Zophobas morio]|uniref:Uncharacterized protein n=1 Tax=Zophobas morio TaxID=2755281 RepID=A0AA38I4I5_9CUCU|nr:hypothetical protein Zmor_019922 [Zophobas morio]